MGLNPRHVNSPTNHNKESFTAALPEGCSPGFLGFPSVHRKRREKSSLEPMNAGQHSSFVGE